MSESRRIKVVKKVEVIARNDEASLRSIEISQLRILARKRPEDFQRVYIEIFVDKREVVTA
jgi:hypothetical protein